MPKTALSGTALRDLLAEPAAGEAESLVDGILPASGTSIVAAKPKVGKTTLGQNLAVSVARGSNFLGRRVQKGIVIYLALEEKRAEVRKRFSRMGATGDELDSIQIFAGQAPSDVLPRLAVEIDKRKPALIIVDTLQRFARIRDLNDYSLVNLQIEPLMTLARKSGAHLMFIHHSPKKGGTGVDAVLGSTALAGAVDTVLTMRRRDADRIIASQQRYGEDLPETVLVMDRDSFVVSSAGTKDDADLRKIKTEMLAYLATLEVPVDEPTIEENVEGRTGVKRKALRELVTEHKVAQSGEGKRGDPYRYLASSFFVPDAPRERGKRGMQNAERAGDSEVYSCSQGVGGSNDHRNIGNDLVSPNGTPHNGRWAVAEAVLGDLLTPDSDADAIP